jgi:hypothetical protein
LRNGLPQARELNREFMPITTSRDLRLLLFMHAIILATLLAAASATGDPVLEQGTPITAEDIARLKALGPNAVFIADGHAELIFLVTVLDSATGKPIPDATVSVLRDQRVSRHLGETYGPIRPRVTDSRGRATLKGKFPMAADAEGASVFVVDSYVEVAAPRYAVGCGRLSPIYRLDFPRGTRLNEVPIQITLWRR